MKAMRFHRHGGPEVLQLDEVPLTLLCDETNRGIARQHGEDPDKLVDVYIDLINRAVRAETTARRLAQMLDELERGDLYMGMAWRPGRTA